MEWWSEPLFPPYFPISFLAGPVLGGNSFSDLLRLNLLGGCKFDSERKAVFAIGIGGQLH